MADSFFTIAAPSEAKYTEKMSRFLAFAAPVQSVAEAKGFISKVANDYHDARHVCWAYMVGPRRVDFLSSDNGEPSGTAGKPILGQINSFGLTDVAIAVVRYFGGIKLGTSGLIAAYRQAARMCLEEATIIELHERADIKITFPYLAMNQVMKVAKMPQCTVLSQEFDNTCSMRLQCNADDEPMLRARLDGIDGVEIIE